MSVHAKCPECGAELRVPASMAGKRGKCPKCSAAIPIPKQQQLPVAKPLGADPQHAPANTAKPPVRTPQDPADHAKPPVVGQETAAAPAVIEDPAHVTSLARHGKGDSVGVLLAVCLGAVAMLAIVVGAGWFLTQSSVDIAERSTDEADQQPASSDEIPTGPSEDTQGDAPSDPTGTGEAESDDTDPGQPETPASPDDAPTDNTGQTSPAPTDDPIDEGTELPPFSASDTAQLLEELIAMSNQMARELSTVTDAATARQAAPRVQPIIDRQTELLKELAALKTVTPSEQFEPLQEKYGDRVKAAAQRAVVEHTRVLGNTGLMAAWGEGLLGKEGPPSTPPSETDLADQQKLANALDKHIAALNKTADALATIRDDTSPRKARLALLQSTIEYERAAREYMQMITATAASQSVIGERADKMAAAEDRLFSEIERVARGPNKAALKRELADLVNVGVRVAPNAPLRAKAEEEAQQRLEVLGLD